MIISNVYGFLFMHIACMCKHVYDTSWDLRESEICDVFVFYGKITGFPTEEICIRLTIWPPSTYGLEKVDSKDFDGFWRSSKKQ